MTFYQKFQAQEGGLVRLDIPEWRGLSSLSGKIGVVYSVDCWWQTAQAPRGAAKVTLFTDGKVHTAWLYEEEVEFL